MSKNYKATMGFYVFIFLVVSTLSVTFASEQDTARIYLTNETANPEVDVSISINIFVPSGIAGANFIVEYPSELEYISYKSSLGASANATSNGQVKVSFFGTDAIHSEETIMTLTFKVKATGHGTYIPVKLSEVKGFDINGETITLLSENGTITVGELSPSHNSSIAVALLIGSPNAIAGDQSVIENGALTQIDGGNPAITPIVVDGRTLVPVRFLTEKFGGSVAWDEKTRTVTIATSTNKTAQLKLDSNEMTVDGNQFVLDVPAQTIEGRTMLPLRAFVENALGKRVFYDNRGLIVISDNENLLTGKEELIQKLISLLKNAITGNSGDTVNTPTPPSTTTKTISGSIMRKEQVDVYEYTAPVSGIYQFEFLSDNPKGDYKVTICNERDTELRYSYFSWDGVSCELNANQTYKLYVRQSSDYMRYDINIHVPTIIKVQHGGTKLSGSITRKEQVDVYEYIAPTSGIYQFEFLSDYAKGDYKFTICNERDTELRYSYFSWDGVSCELNENQTYKLYVHQSSDYMKYDINIHSPTINSIRGNETRLSGSITRKEQIDVWEYTPLVSGIYQFEFLSDYSRGDYKFIIYDERNTELKYSYFSWEGVSYDLNGNQTYKFHVRQSNDYMRYDINIFVPTVKAMQVGETKLVGNILRKEQSDVYRYVAPKSGEYKFEFSSDYDKGDYKFIICDTSDMELKYSYFSWKSLSLELDASKEYLFYIRQSNGYMKYDVSITVP